MLYFLRSPLQNPRVLSCLHVFCENCLLKLLSTDNSSAITTSANEVGGSVTASGAGTGGSVGAATATTTASSGGGIDRDLVHMHLKTQIECPICKQTTMVSRNDDDHDSSVSLRISIIKPGWSQGFAVFDS